MAPGRADTRIANMAALPLLKDLVFAEVKLWVFNDQNRKVMLSWWSFVISHKQVVVGSLSTLG